MPASTADSRYYLFVEAPGHGGSYLREVKLDQEQLKVALGPELTIQGKIIHAPPSAVHMGKVYYFDLARQSNPRDPGLSESEAATIEEAAAATLDPNP